MRLPNETTKDEMVVLEYFNTQGKRYIWKQCVEQEWTEKAMDKCSYITPTGGHSIYPHAVLSKNTSGPLKYPKNCHFGIRKAQKFNLEKF